MSFRDLLKNIPPDCAAGAQASGEVQSGGRSLLARMPRPATAWQAPMISAGSAAHGCSVRAVLLLFAPGALSDLSVHMCFICVLHLANEHGLAIEGQESMEELKIRNVQAAAC